MQADGSRNLTTRMSLSEDLNLIPDTVEWYFNPEQEFLKM
jgi:hypothetical protein